jgi:hypothetical protein
MLGIYKRKHEGSKVYYANAKEYTFCAKVLVDGKPEQHRHPVTGNPLSLPDGTPIYREHIVNFQKWADRFTEDGYWSVFEVIPSTLPEVAAKVEEMAAARNNPTVITEEDFLKRFHPLVLEEKKEIKKKDRKIQQQQDEIERLKLRKG